jgi:hypothetical protein
MSATVIDVKKETNGEVSREITLDHLTAIPRYTWISEEVAAAVYDSVSHDHLEALILAEVGEMHNGPEPMLKVVWEGKWNDGHTSTYKFLVPEGYARTHLEKLPVSMQHRLQRQVYREDMYLSF